MGYRLGITEYHGTIPHAAVLGAKPQKKIQASELLAGRRAM